MTARILVIEDNEDNRKLLTLLLKDEGYDYTEAATAEEGMALLGRQPIDLVLMDIYLPGMDGDAAVRRLRADPRFMDLPVIAVTAHAIQGKDAEILASGFSALVTKPLDEDRLFAEIRALLPKGSPSYG